VFSRICNQVARQAENLLCATAQDDDPQVRQARLDIEQTLHLLRQRIQDYERLRSHARGLGCSC
jgi:ElaB/YqjD/DUF883 family membrane-anchored ribosome-binding protein